jgi:four helix bundle protein
MKGTSSSTRPGMRHAIASDVDKPRSFRDLEVWQRGMDLVDLTIRATAKLPRQEFEHRSQMRRAATSIPFNVAEGYRRKKERAAYQNHVSIAMGSQGELETGMEIAFRNAWLAKDEWRECQEFCV